MGVCVYVRYCVCARAHPHPWVFMVRGGGGGGVCIDVCVKVSVSVSVRESVCVRVCAGGRGCRPACVRPARFVCAQMSAFSRSGGPNGRG